MINFFYLDLFFKVTRDMCIVFMMKWVGGGGDMFSSENSVNFYIDLLKCHIFVLKNCVYKT